MFTTKVLEWEDIQLFINRVSSLADESITQILVRYDTELNTGLRGESKFAIFVDEPEETFHLDEIRTERSGSYLYIYVEDLVQHMMSTGELEPDTYLVYYEW